ncbi:MAG: DUF922 domain-containing protein [Alteromonadaceae bacterium]|nr:DUF922 domain-containing protein [Alteromonadaceae bacterium]
MRSVINRNLLAVCVLFMGTQYVSAQNTLQDQQIRVIRSTDHYQVEVRGDELLRTAIKRASPIVKAGKGYFAQTQWTVEPMFALQTYAGLCRVRQLSVKLRLKIMMPQLINSEQLSEQKRKRFDFFYNALSKHERGHAEIAHEAASAVYQAISMIPANLDCKAIHEKVEQKYHSILEDYQRKNSDYDQETDFGRTQGAAI